MGLKLFDGDGDGDDVENISKIEINKDFARRYEHNKKREDLQRLQELQKKGVVEDDDSDSDESEEDDEEDEFKNASKTKDLKFFDALIKVRNQDPILKSKEAQLFESESEPEDENNAKAKKEKKKPMYIKDVTSKLLMEEGPEFEDEDEEEAEGETGKKKTYLQEQEELRKAFLDAVKEEEGEQEGDEDGDLFKVKVGGRRGDGVEDEEEDEGIGRKLNEYFGEDEKLDEDMKFLKKYFQNRMWAEEGKGSINGRFDDGAAEQEVVEFSEDEDEIERQEDYEREYNFRFEENTGDRVLGHARKVEGSVRKKANARKLQRERKEERIAQAEEEKKEELKRLKNLKKKEMMEKLMKIKETAGIGNDGVCPLDIDDLEEEFDPNEYDRKMKEAFGDAYYDADDADPDFGSDEDEDGGQFEKPDFEKEDELLGLPKGWDDVNEHGGGFLSTREKMLKSRIENECDSEQAEDEEYSEPEENKRKKKRKKDNSVMQAVRDELMEEYYKLDYEDTIGDLKTRFKYKPVKPKRYGLSTEAIMVMDDKELNQYVSLKKLAPYQEKEWKVPSIKAYQQKKRVKELLQEGISDIQMTKKKKLQGHVRGAVNSPSTTDNGKSLPQESSDATGKLSRGSRRRRRQAELRLPPSRLLAYGKIPTKSKSKKK